MRATSDGQYVDFTVHVIINVVVDEPPVIANPVSDVVFNEYPQTIQVNLDGVATDPDDPDELIDYTILSNSNEESLSVTMSRKVLILERLTEDQAVADVELRATSDGQFVDFTVHVIMNPVEGVAENQMAKMVYPNPSRGMVTIVVEGDSGFEYRVFDMTGRTVLRGRHEGHEVVLDLGGAGKGVYLISVTCDAKHLMQKVVVQ